MYKGIRKLISTTNSILYLLIGAIALLFAYRVYNRTRTRSVSPPSNIPFTMDFSNIESDAVEFKRLVRYPLFNRFPGMKDKQIKRLMSKYTSKPFDFNVLRDTYSKLYDLNLITDIRIHIKDVNIKKILPFIDL